MAQTRACFATQLIDTNTHPLPVLGSKEGTGFVGTGTTDDVTDALYITGLKENEIYELTFFDDGDKELGTAPNVYIRPGGVVTTAAVTTSSFLWPASIIPVIQIKLEGDQQSIGVLAAGTGTGATTCYVTWRRMT